MRRLAAVVLSSVLLTGSAFAQVQLLEGFEGPDNIPTSSGGATTTPSVFTTPTGSWVFLKAYKSNSTNAAKIGTYMGRLLNNAAAGGSYMITPRLVTADSLIFKSLRDRTYKTYLSVDSIHFALIDSQYVKTGSYYRSRINEGSTKVWLKIANESANDTDIDSVMVTSTPATAPLLSISSDVLPTFGTVVAGTASAWQCYTITGRNLTADVAVTAPAGFQVGKDSVTFSSSAVLQQTGGVLTDTIVYVRFMPSAAVGTIAANILHTSAGANARNLSINGTALAVQPVTPSVIRFGSITGTSVQALMAGGGAVRRILVVRADSIVAWMPADGTPVTGVSSNFAQAEDHAGRGRAVYDGSDTTVTVTGLGTGVRYYFAAFEYNVGTGNSQNYLETAPGPDSISTLKTSGLNVSPATLAFGDVLISSRSTEKTFLLTARYLSPLSGTVTVTAPSGFEISAGSGTGYGSTVQIPYTAGSIAGQSIYVQFIPAALGAVSDSIVCTGGGAEAMPVRVGGKGVNEVITPDVKPFGFASAGSGTTGGAGGPSIVVTTGAQLAAIMLPREKNVTTPLILYISGTLTGLADEVSIKRTENITILGLGRDATLRGFGLKLVDARNIIVRNITFSDCTAGEKDGIAVESSTNVWVDHCTFTDSPSIDISGSSHDGQLDVKKGSANVTLSWNHFMNHRKTCLLGHSPSETGDTALRVTYYHNWFDGTYSRHPRARYGKAHIINNLYSGTGVVGADAGGYGVGSTCGASLLVEANYFENTPKPVLISQVNDPGETLSGDPVGYVKVLNNYLTGSGALVENTGGYNFQPSDSYHYSARDAQAVKDVVKAAAGAGVMDIATAVRHDVPNGASIPSAIELHQNFPNPFNPSTQIEFALPAAAYVTLSVYDVLGRQVAVLAEGLMNAGPHQVRWNAGANPSGIYFCRLQAGGLSRVTRMLLMK